MIYIYLFYGTSYHPDYLSMYRVRTSCSVRTAGNTAAYKQLYQVYDTHDTPGIIHTIQHRRELNAHASM